MDERLVGRWRELAGWLDDWFVPDQADRNGFDGREREVFDELSTAWRAGADKLAALESTSERFGRDHVRDVIRSLNARNTADYWAGLTTREGRNLDDLVRLLWGPLPAQGFEFTMVRDAAGARFDCRRCPINDLAADLQAAGYDRARYWLFELICSTDFYTTGSLDPPVGFSRTHTLMQGSDHCDHTYTLA